MAIGDAHGLPVALCTTSANPHESQLVEETLKNRFTHRYPRRLIGDKAYDSDLLDSTLAERFNIKMIAPNRRNRQPTQDGRPLRRYKRRWKIERLFAWLQNYRRLVIRYEYYLENFRAFLLIAATIILLKYF